MAKMRAAFAAVLFAAAYALAGSVVYATGWAAVPPGEVAERADIIVTGRYDFASDMTVSEAPIFVGYAFEVERVYRGEVPRRMTAGIDFNDVAIARECRFTGRCIADREIGYTQTNGAIDQAITGLTMAPFSFLNGRR